MGLIRKLDPTGSIRFSVFKRQSIPASPGVYIVRCLENGRPRFFNRINGRDKEGILDIGKSVNLRNRINSFVSDASFNDLRVHGHSGAWNFRQFFRDNPKPKAIILRLDDLQCFWKVMDSEVSADDFETNLIHEYVFRFQDKPPLNISIKRRREE